MTDLFTDVEPGIVACVLAVAMLAAWAVGWWRGRALADHGAAAGGKLSDAIMALLGLLLAFTFSMSLVKHEQRRQMAVTDSNAIGDFYT